MVIITSIFLFVIGLCFGSLGSVIIFRLGKKIDFETIKSIVLGRSQCPHCSHNLNASDLIPLVSFLIRRGKCKYCKGKISNRYPILELASGIIFVASYIFLYSLFDIYIPGILLLFRIFVNRGLLLILINDIIYYELNMPIRMLMITVIALSQFGNKLGNYTTAFWSSILFGCFFYIIYIFAKRYVKIRYQEKKEGIGQGDILMGFLIGTLVPFIIQYNGLGNSIIYIADIMILFIIFSSIIGLAIGTIKLLIYGKAKSSYNIIPFLPAMIIAFWILLWNAKYFINIFFRIG